MRRCEVRPVRKCWGRKAGTYSTGHPISFVELLVQLVVPVAPRKWFDSTKRKACKRVRLPRKLTPELSRAGTASAWMTS